MAETAKHAVVIGAGLGGLAAAVRLAARGWRVTVLERHSRPGGKMNLWEAAGARFDTGPSLVTMPWAFEELFRAAGTTLVGEGIELMEVQPFCRCHFDDGAKVTLDGRLPELLSSIRSLEGGSAEGFLRMLATGAAMYGLSRETFFVRSPREGPDLAALSHLRRAPLGAFMRSYHSMVSRCCRGPQLRQILDRYPTYVGSSPYRTSGILTVIPATEFLFGGWHVLGGLYRLVEALVRMLARLGVEVRTGSPVVRIRHQNGRATGVETTNGDVVTCDAVIMNGDSSRIAALLGKRSGSDLPMAARSLSGIVFLYVVRGKMEGWPHHQVAFSADYPAEFSQLFDEGRFPDDPTVYVCTPSRTDTSVAPDGFETIFVMANAPASDESWGDGMVEVARSRVMARLSRAGLGDWQERIVSSDVRTPRWLAETFDMPGGAIYGQNSHGWRGAALRPPNRVRSVRGVYAVGGSTHPGGGTPTVLMSARIASDLVERHERP